VDPGEEDRRRNVTVRVRRPGLRALHPSRYVFRSDGAKRESLLRAAWNAPELFQTGIVRAHLFPLQPLDKTRWDALLAVSFPVPLAGTAGKDVRREFGAVLNRGAAVVHRFSRRITLQPDGPEVASRPTITFLERVALTPGRYTLTTVLADPLDVDPHAAKISIEVPEIPRRELFLVDPILGRPAGPNLVVLGQPGGDEIGAVNSFEPLVVQQLDEPLDLVSLTEACFVGKKKGGRRARRVHGAIARSLFDANGRTVGHLDPVELALKPDPRQLVLCQNLVDVLPAAKLPEGRYVFEATLPDPARPAATARVRFAIGSGTAAAEHPIED
jgi:hypothetical protein